MTINPFIPATFSIKSKKYQYFSIKSVCSEFGINPDQLPYSVRILMEAAIRKCDGVSITQEDIRQLVEWKPQDNDRKLLAFFPARVVLQDFTGVPVLVDLAAMRTEMERRGGDPAKINPVIPVDLVIDHSIQMDYAGLPDALSKNVQKEYDRNGERYHFLRWAQQAFTNLRIVPPSNGIIHQVNLERLSPVVQVSEGEIPIVYLDSVLGTDSHTPMINGLGVLGWGVGGIEAIAAMLNQPVELLTPDVIGIRLTGQLRAEVTPTDLTLHLTQMLRKTGVVNKFLEYFGPGLKNLSLADRAMIANMTPENGATVSYFPVDSHTLEYLRMTGRSEKQVALVQAYFEVQGLIRTSDSPDPVFSSIIELNLDEVVPSVAGPKRPQDRVDLKNIKSNFLESLIKPKSERGYQLQPGQLNCKATVSMNGKDIYTLAHGSVVLAAITSCTNTSNPQVMITAGLLAKKAVELGLRVPKTVKTSLAPGSKVVAEYLRITGLQKYLDQLGFHVAGFGCATCIGNSGPLPEEISSAIKNEGLVVAAVLSGNRNFEGRVSPSTLANYLASPPLVVAFALAGRVDIDFKSEPIGVGTNNKPVFLRDLWPAQQEVASITTTAITPDLFTSAYADVFTGDSTWQSMEISTGSSYQWEALSSYIQEPPYFKANKALQSIGITIRNARILAIFGDSVTTDHISPAGNIAPNSPAGMYLQGLNIAPLDFNSYGSRRGNDQVMVRGAFANQRLRNFMAGGKEGGFTTIQPEGELMTIYDAAVRYTNLKTPLVILAGKEYGTGSSRDWAAKGPMLLGVRVVVAESFERIHRSNLAGMGILPLQFMPGENAASLGLNGTESLSFDLPEGGITPGCMIPVAIIREDNTALKFKTSCRLDTSLEIQYFRHGGLLPEVLARTET
ncbi:MAG: aconitate hydratase AcnA [Leptolinea sp.]